MEILTMDVFEIECELGNIGEGGRKDRMGKLLRFQTVFWVFGFRSPFFWLEVNALER